MCLFRVLTVRITTRENPSNKIKKKKKKLSNFPSVEHTPKWNSVTLQCTEIELNTKPKILRSFFLIHQGSGMVNVIFGLTSV